MENYFKYIEKKLEKKINFEKLEIIDNSQKHKGHKFFSEEPKFLVDLCQVKSDLIKNSIS